MGVTNDWANIFYTWHDFSPPGSGKCSLYAPAPVCQIANGNCVSVFMVLSRAIIKTVQLTSEFSIHRSTVQVSRATIVILTTLLKGSCIKFWIMYNSIADRWCLSHSTKPHTIVGELTKKRHSFFSVESCSGCPRKNGYERMCPYLKTYFMYVLVTMISYSHVLFKVVATNPRSIDQILFKIWPQM